MLTGDHKDGIGNGITLTHSNGVSWQELLECDMQQPDRIFPRSAACNDLLADHRAYLMEIGRSTNQDIHESYLRGKRYVLCDNKFPYMAELGIRHRVFWMDPAHKLDMMAARDIISGLIVGPFVLFENLPARQSVPLIPHYHVFTIENDRPNAI
jgi:hypothetical protein